MPDAVTRYFVTVPSSDGEPVELEVTEEQYKATPEALGFRTALDTRESSKRFERAIPPKRETR